MLIVGYHVAKTGGTSVMHHVRDSLGPEAYFGFGLQNAALRFFAGEPLWEELTDAERAPVKFIFGHQMNDGVLEGLPADAVALFTVLRDPFDHFVSQYKHHLGVIGREGQHVSARAYFADWDENRVTRQIFDYFPRLHGDEDAGFSRDAVFHVLRQFRFLCATEALAVQSAPLCRALGLPPVEGRHRVSDRTVDLEGLTPGDVYERCPVDHEVHQALMAADTPERAGGSLAYDDAAFRASMARLAATGDAAKRVRKAYRKLAAFLRRHDRIEAAQLFLTLSGRDDPKFAPIRNMAPTPEHAVMPEARARSEREKAAVYRRHGDLAAARASFEKAIALNDRYLDAYAGYARLLIAEGEPAAARAAVDWALDIDPGFTQARKLKAALS